MRDTKQPVSEEDSCQDEQLMQVWFTPMYCYKEETICFWTDTWTHTQTDHYRVPAFCCAFISATKMLKYKTVSHKMIFNRQDRLTNYGQSDSCVHNKSLKGTTISF